MNRLRILKTANFKLAVLYAVVFGLSVATLGVIVFLSVRSSLQEQIRTHIQTEVAQLLIDYGDDGLDELRHDVHERIESRPADRFRYSVISPKGKIIFDKLPHIPTREGWHVVPIRDGRSAPKALLYVTPLKDRYWLAVGADLSRTRAAENAVRYAFGWATLFTVLAGACGGIWVSRRFLAQIDAITRTAERIGSGQLFARLPLRGTGDDLDELAGVINRMLDRIQHLMANVQNVATNIAHDLRTPLGHLRQTLEELSKEPLSEKEIVLLEEAIDQLDQVLTTFAALLRIAEVESGSRKAGFEMVDLSATLWELADTYQPIVEENSQQLEVSLQDNIRLRGDHSLMVQLFSNLIENAIRHAGKDKRISISLQRSAEQIIIRVADNGPGIPRKEYDNIIKPFYRLDRSRNTPGSGLGMSLVAAIAALHDMELSFEDNQPGLAIILTKAL